MKKIYRYYVDCDRSGKIEGLFIATKEEVKNIIGETIYFGEILGKHSDVRGTIEEDEIKEIEGISQQTIKELEEKIGCTLSGYNPLEYI